MLFSRNVRCFTSGPSFAMTKRLLLIDVPARQLCITQLEYVDEHDFIHLTLTIHLSKWVLDSISSSPVDNKEAKAKSVSILKRLGHEEMKLNEYERTCSPSWSRRIMLIGSSPEMIAGELIHPDDIDVRFSGPSSSSTPFYSTDNIFLY